MVIIMGRRYSQSRSRRVNVHTSVRRASRSSVTGRTPSRTSVTGTQPSRTSITRTQPTGRTPGN